MRAVNLIPNDDRRRSGSMPVGAPFLGLVGALALALVAVVLLVSGHNSERTRGDQLRSLRASVSEWSMAAASFDHDVALSKQTEATIGSVETVAKQRYAWSELLSQLAGTLPKTTVLKSLSTGAATASPTGTTGSAVTSTSAPGQIVLTACAPSQAGIANTMDSLRRLSGVSSVTLGSDTSAGGTGGSSGGSSSGGCGASSVDFGLTLGFATTPSASSTAAPTATTGTEAADATTTGGS